MTKAYVRDIAQRFSVVQAKESISQVLTRVEAHRFLDQIFDQAKEDQAKQVKLMHVVGKMQREE